MKKVILVSIDGMRPTVATVMGVPIDPDWEGEYVNNKLKKADALSECISFLSHIIFPTCR